MLQDRAPARHRAGAPALSLARRARHLGARSDGDPVHRGAAGQAQVRGDRRVPHLRRRRRPAQHAARSSSSPGSTACSCIRIPTPTRSSATSSRTRTRACCGRIRASSGRRTCARCCAAIDPVVRSRLPHRARLERQGDAGLARGLPRFPDRFLVGTDTFTPERLHYVAEHARWSRQWLADLPRDVAEKIGFRNGERLFGGPPP